MATNKKKIMVSEVPFLMAQWDFEKNLEFDPNTITAGSNKRPFWKCKNAGTLGRPLPSPAILQMVAAPVVKATKQSNLESTMYLHTFLS